MISFGSLWALDEYLMNDKGAKERKKREREE